MKTTTKRKAVSKKVLELKTKRVTKPTISGQTSYDFTDIQNMYNEGFTDGYDKGKLDCIMTADEKDISNAVSQVKSWKRDETKSVKFMWTCLIIAAIVVLLFTMHGDHEALLAGVIH